MTSPRTLAALQQKIWEGCVPLDIRLANAECKTYDKSNSFLILFPRILYLPLLLPRLHAFFRSSLINSNVTASEGWLSFEDVPLKWHLPAGLLFDIYSGAKDQLQDENDGGNKSAIIDPNHSSTNSLPWKLILHFSDWPEEQLPKLDITGKILQDAFTNSLKEASAIRHGSEKVFMSLSKDHSTQLWTAIDKHDMSLFNDVNRKLLRPAGEELRHIPIKLYLPAAAIEDSSGNTSPGHLRVVQSPVPPSVSSRQPQTLGTALNALLPSLFPSRRSALLAYPVLHGAVVPLSVNIQELGEFAAYADGFLHVVVAMMS